MRDGKGTSRSVRAAGRPASFQLLLLVPDPEPPELEVVAEPLVDGVLAVLLAGLAAGVEEVELEVVDGVELSDLPPPSFFTEP